MKNIFKNNISILLVSIFSILSFVFLPTSKVEAQSLVIPEAQSVTVSGYNLEIYIPAGATGTLPAVVFIPGNGEVGTDRTKLYSNGPLYFIKNSGWRPNFVVVGAQPSAAWPSNAFTHTILTEVVSNSAYHVDPSRVYLTGLSGGAAAVGYYIHNTYNQYNPSNLIVANPVPLAAVVPMSITMSASCGDFYAQTDYLCGGDLNWANVASWGFAGSSDSHWEKMKRFFERLSQAGYNSRWTTYSGGHSGWNTYYNPTYTESINGTSMNIYDWMLQYSSGSNPPPPSDTTSPSVPTSLSSTSTTQTQTTISWSASTDNLGVTGYKIYKNGVQLATSTSTSYTATGLTSSTTYSFTVAAYDAAGNNSTQSSALSVTTQTTTPTNIAPVSSAGTDKSITLPTSTVTLSGSGTDSDGTISSYAWTKVSGGTATITSPSSASTTITGLTQGTYVFWLTVTDNSGATNADAVSVVVNAAAGGGTTIGGLVAKYTFDSNSINWSAPSSEILDSVGSYHGDAVGLSSGNSVIGKIGQALQFNGTQYIASSTAANIISPSTNFTISAWVNTPASLVYKTVFSKASVNNREMQLMLNTSGGVSSFVGGTNNTNIQQLLPSNQWVHLTLVNNAATGTHSTYMNGTLVQSLASGTTTAPGMDFIIGARRNNTNTDAGIYFNGLIDDVRIYNRVLSQGEINSIATLSDTNPITTNIPPTANAGVDQTITLPTSTVTLSGSGTDSDGTISSYAWTKVSGSGTITSASSTSTTVTGLTAGTSTFRLTVTDNGGLTASDDVVVVVGGVVSVNTCPSKKIVILGSSTAAGTGASPSSNAWASKFATYFVGLSTGNTVDNLAFSGYTTYNILPTGTTVPAGFTVGTGSNITAAISRNPCAIIINMPSNDEANNLSIATQQSNWEIIATTAQNANIPIWVTTTQPREWPLTNQGRLNLMTMRDWITTRFGSNSIDFWTTVANADGTVNPIYNSDGVHVNNLGHDLFYNRVRSENIPGTSVSTNTPPTASAGTDKTITLPTNTVTLTGSGTDTGGSISSYSWTKVSTLAGTITSPSSASTSITGLVAGTHTFRLTVTDNGGLTASDDVVVVVGGGGTCKSVSSVGIIPSGGADFWFMGNFNTAFNLNPCDTVVLQAGTYGRIDIGIADGITFKNNGQVIINSVNFYPGSKNVKLLGNGTPGIQYGIKLNGTNSFATYWKATGDLEIAYIEVVGTAAGIEVKHPPGEAYTQNFANVKIHDNYIHDHRLEGMYIGMDNLSLDVLINAEIYNNIVKNSGNDGIQTRNGTFNIHDNIVDNVALSPAFPYDINGILVGGNTKDSTIRNNTITRVPGTAIFNNGWGNHTISCNVVSSTQPGIFTKNYEFATEDLQHVGFQNFNIQNNTITSTSGIALQTYYNSNGSTTVTNFSNNKTSGSVDAQYSITQSNNNANVVPNCSNIIPPPATTGGVKVGPGEYQTAYIDSSGYLWAVGNISNIGTGGAGTVGVPQRVKVTPLDLKFKEVAGGLHGLGAIDINGNVWMFGDNDFAQHGQGNTTHPVLLPQKILTDNSGNPFTNIKSLALGYRNVGGQNFQVALKEDGTIWAWGYLKAGLLGNGTNIDQLTTRPVQITLPGGRLVKQIIAGTFIMALATDGTVWSWGDAGSANLGYTVIGMDYATPHQIPGLSNISQIAGGLLWNYALSNTGILYGWGSWGDYLGNANGNPVNTPTALTSMTSSLPYPIQKIVTNSFNTYVILTDKSLWSWGNNGQGSVGNGQKIDFSLGGNPFDRSNLLVRTPYHVAPTKKFDDVFGSTVYTYYVYAIDDAGQLYSWGRNKGSVLADGIRSGGSGSLDATYGNSWDVAWPTPVNPFTMTTSYVMTASACIANPTVSPCNMYTIPANTPPIANAGIDQSVVGAVATLNGASSTDNVFIPYYEWSQVSGPNTAIIDLPASKTPKVSGLVTGTYIFKLKVTDTGWATNTDTVQISVNGATPTNQSPISNAGPDQSIILPTSSVALTGSGTDYDGTISTYTWTKVLGTGGVITSPSQATTTVTGLAQGIYTFRLTVTDNGGLTATDDVSIVINAPGFTLSAGTDQSITLPTSLVTLTAAVSGGATASSYSWLKTTGGTANITSPSLATTMITGLTQGTYDFQVTVTDTYGRVLADTVRVIVNGINPPILTNNPPVVNAGADQTVTGTTLHLTGQASDLDSDPLTYLWQQVFGPNQSTITSPTSLSTNISNLVPGTYTFSLSATDSKSQTTSDLISVLARSTTSGGGGGGGTAPIIQTPINSGGGGGISTKFPVISLPVTTNNRPSINIPVIGIKKGSGLANVKTLQTFLNWILGTKITPLVVDGKWGPKTTNAIKLYQSANGLKSDGAFGKLSAAKAISLLGGNTVSTPTTPTTTSIYIPAVGVRSTSSIEDIKSLKKFLNQYLGTKITPLVVDGSWGLPVIEAIKLFQTLNGFKTDGSFGKISAGKAITLQKGI